MVFCEDQIGPSRTLGRKDYIRLMSKDIFFLWVFPFLQYGWM
jgi:hypothetical protein